ncbi:MAG: TonB-dependent receptor [Flammeovirgaceae bacterium]
MKQTFYKFYMLLCMLIFMSSAAFAQTTVSGSVTDVGGDPLAGVNIVIKGTVSGTITDVEGNFTLRVKTVPATLVFSMIGFASQELEVSGNMSDVKIKLEENTILGEEVVISASRVEESIMESPVTIEKMDILNIQNTAAADFYDGLANLKGVHVNQGSLTFTSINTRGFASIANTRFVQLMDGMDNAAPLLNFPTGNVVGISELDMESMELVPGSGSALYGPNAFNGILFMNSKSPFEYQGLSAQAKVGVTNSDAGGTDPYYNFAVRYAKSFNDKFAFKVNFSILDAEDWRANRYSESRALQSTINNRTMEGDPNFDGLNLYGDETEITLPGPFLQAQTGLPLDGIAITRTGFREEDLLDNNDARSIKMDAALHYRINDNLELSYNYRRGAGSSIYQGTERYALRDFVQQFHKVELKGSNFFVRSYMSQTDDGDSYNLSALGAFANERFSPSEQQWVPEYVGAYATALAPIYMAGGTPSEAQKAAAHDAARAFADRNIPAATEVAWQDTVRAVRQGLLGRDPSGAGFVDDSRLFHTEFNYNFSELIDPTTLELQIGGNFRRYDLFSDGTVFNENPDGVGDNERVGINEFGLYFQAAKKLIDDRLKLTGSLRYDKNENFDGQINPRLSAVYSAGATRQHNFRASFQTGFRNPDTQAQFILFETSSGWLVGGVRENAEEIGIYEGGAYTNSSWQAFQGSVLAGNPNPALLEEINLDYVKPERLTAFEVGYKGNIGSNFLLDANVYHNRYKDFIVLQTVAAKGGGTRQGEPVQMGDLFRPYHNADEDLTSTGVGLGFAAKLPKGYTLEGNYSYATFSADNADPDFEAGFNTPENRFSLTLGNREIVKNLGASVSYRWQEEFFWQNSFGVGTVPAFGVLDAQVSYRVPSIKTVVKLGGTNIGGNEYFTNTGGPSIGSLYYISLTFDEFFR